MAAEPSSSRPVPGPTETTDSPAESSPNDPVSISTPACLILGMAGCGKTTLVESLCSYLEDADELADTLSQLELTSDQLRAHQKPPELQGDGAYIVNLDPAVHEVPYEPNIDIRDTVKYKDVMSHYGLGPNGAIITSLNLYSTRFDQVLSLMEKRAPEYRAVLLDTPGQIETFTWSASGTVITDALALTLPTVILFVIDTERSRSAMTFVSNMLYACSIMYKTRLPMVIVFNKIDVADCRFAQAWMRDFDDFDAALKEENFVGTLARSMAMALEEFYNSMKTVAVSAHTGEGMPELVTAIREAAVEYDREYKPLIDERKRRRAENDVQREERELERFTTDAGGDLGSGPRFASDESDDEDEEDPNPMVSTRHEDKHEIRLAKMKGTLIDSDKEDAAYKQFMQHINEEQGGH